MYECNTCKKIIKNDNLGCNFQFILGKMKSGKFIGEKSYYYHLKCLKVTDIPK
jgi:hypothetical protein